MKTSCSAPRFSLLLALCFVADSAHDLSAADRIKLNATNRQKCLQVLREGLRSTEFWPSIHAAEGLTLGGHGDEVIAFLEPLRKGPYDDQQRCGLARELVRAGRRDAAKIMLDILAGEDDFGHVHAAESLYKVGELGDGNAMRKAFAQDKNARLKLMAAAALGKSGDAKALAHAREMMFDKDPELARTAAWIIARIGSKEDVPALMRGREKMPDEFSRSYFEHALATLGDEEGRKALLQNLNSKDAAVRTYAATFAGDARTMDVAPRLIELLNDENIDVRVRSAQSLLVLAQEPVDPADLSVLPDAKLSVYHSLAKKAHAALHKRREEFEKLSTLEECQAWQKSRREFFIKALGGFPEKAPLNAKVVGELDGGEYRVEKVIYESRPHHHVTATLYLPKSKAPYPAVVIACGHTKSGKAADYNQRLGILLAKYGMAAMCYDPIGQGERSQTLDDDGKAPHGSTTEHFFIGVGSILTGTNTAGYRIWDGIRGIDYLCSRPDIIAEKIGCTGCSGGGTLTSYLMALDERVYCAAPACYLTTLGRLIDTIGPQDAEQNIHGQIAFGMDQTDYVLMRAPKPTLICSTTDDFFDIQGTWDNFRQSKRFYGLMGHPERVDLVETPGKHGVTQTGREAIVRWMQRWLLGIDKQVSDPGAKTWTQEELRCTPKGEVLLLEGEKSVFDLNKERAQVFAARRKGFAELPPDLARDRVRRVAGIRKLENIPVATFRTIGMARRGDLQIRKLAMEISAGVQLPILRLIPSHPKGGLTLFLSGSYKNDVIDNDLVREVLHDGREVWALDLPGIGELRHPGSSEKLGDWKTFYLSYLLGQSLVGQRTEHVITGARSMQILSGSETKPMEIIATDEACTVAIHAKAVEPNLFGAHSFQVGGKALPLTSWTEICGDSNPSGLLTSAIHRALHHYDLLDLERLDVFPH